MAQVIIPKVIHPQRVEQANLIYSPEESQNILKYETKSSFLASKKHNSAFKFYKEKKSRNKARQNNQTLEVPEASQASVKKVFKLKIRTFPNQLKINSTRFQGENELYLGYCDPNTAPTLIQQSHNQFYWKAKQQKLNQNSENKSIQINQTIKVQNKIIKQAQLHQSQTQFQMQRQEGRKDDTFIIFKKVCIKKAKRLKNNGQAHHEPKRNSGKKGELTANLIIKSESLLTPFIQAMEKEELQIKKEESFSEIERLNSQILKHQLKLQDYKEIAITQKGSGKKIKKEQQMEDNCLAADFILELQIDSVSEVQPQAFDTLSRKKVIPMIK